jgi:hypothetical protein
MLGVCHSLLNWQFSCFSSSFFLHHKIVDKEQGQHTTWGTQYTMKTIKWEKLILMMKNKTSTMRVGRGM